MEMAGKKKQVCSRVIAVFLCICIVFSLNVSIVQGTELTESNARKTQSGIGELLDGDYAYISEAGLLLDKQTESGYSIRTGTAPWDDVNDKGIVGNDTTELDSTVRSFDNVSYTVWFKSMVREDAPYSHYRTGTLHFEFVLEEEEEKAQFEIGAMGWLSAKKDVKYSITTQMRNGNTCQVLRGSYLWEPGDGNETAIGNSYQELNVSLKVLAMQNGETISPEFTFWLEGNEVAEEGVIADNEKICETHNEIESKTIKTPDIFVTAAPRYNVQLKNCDSRVQYISTFDFGSGNESAQNKDAQSVYGRANAVGITIQIVGKSPEHGLKGCEVPDGSPIEFDMVLNSKYLGTNGETHEVTDSCTPLLWSIDGNIKSNVQSDGREIEGSYKFAAGGAPMNTGTTYESCYQGGTWTGIQNQNIVHISVSGYEVNLQSLPYADGNVSSRIYTYYDPNTTKNYWEVQTACFSAGEFWIVQPFNDKDGNYVVDLYGTGTFNTSLTDVKLKMTGISGQELNSVSDNTNQMVEIDDTAVVGMALEQPGTIDQSINYQKYQTVQYGSSLTEGCWEDGKDWIIADGKLNIQESLKQNTAEGMYTGVAYDDLIKFDDEFFELEGIQEGSRAGMEKMTWKYLYGAKPDKSGWNHNDLEPEEAGYDDEMMQATADDLIFFSSLEELKSAGYTCVAVLWEARGLASPQSTNFYMGLQGHVKETAESGKVYMVTHCARAWNKMNIQEAAAQALQKAEAELTEEDYIWYAQSENFPTRENQMNPLSYENDYLSSFWVNDYETRAGLKNYQKSSYDKNGYLGGSDGLSYGDSCLVVAYATKISKNTAQQSTTGDAKRTYDMDVNQRIADYILKPSAVRTAGESTTINSEIQTDIIIEDILPKGLSYIYNSSYVGGAYLQKGEGKQGSVQDGKKLEPEIQRNEDGSTTLRWTLEDVTITGEEVTYFEPIYYSCQIGIPGDEENDVKNNDQLLNQVMIHAKGEPIKEYNETNGNLAKMSIQVSKNNAVSLAKIADNPTVDVGEEMGFSINIGNNADNSMNILAIDSVPYKGDSVGSDFTGACEVTELSVKNPELLENIQIYYTEAESERGKTSVDYETENFSDNPIWTKLPLDKTTGTADLPDKFVPTAVAFVGTLPGQKTLKMHITMYLPEGKPGEHLVNRLTKDDMESDAGSSIVSRTLEGVVWMDLDKDGIRQNSDDKVSGVQAVLIKLKEGGDPEKFEDYEVYEENGKKAVVETGNQINLSTGEVTIYENGEYKFSGLPEGTFGVLFIDGSFSFYQYQASPDNQGEDDTIDSDAIAEYIKDNGVSSIKQAFISNIEMPSKGAMTSLVYSSKHHDLGIYPSEEVPNTNVDVQYPKRQVFFSTLAVIVLSGYFVKKRKERR